MAAAAGELHAQQQQIQAMPNRELYSRGPGLLQWLRHAASQQLDAFALKQLDAGTTVALVQALERAAQRAANNSMWMQTMLAGPELDTLLQGFSKVRRTDMCCHMDWIGLGAAC